MSFIKGEIKKYSFYGHCKFNTLKCIAYLKWASSENMFCSWMQFRKEKKKGGQPSY